MGYHTGSWRQLGQQLRLQPMIDDGKQVKRHDRRTAEIHTEEIVLLKGDQVGDSSVLRIAACQHHELVIDLDTHAACTEEQGSGDHDPPISRTEIIDHVVGSDGSRFEHGPNHCWWRRDVWYLGGRTLGVQGVCCRCNRDSDGQASRQIGSAGHPVPCGGPLCARFG
ncbi:hypothetical protein BH23GEM6_BH23GEM6_01610 [soil metagenome]